MDILIEQLHLEEHDSYCNISYQIEEEDHPKEGQMAFFSVYKETEIVSYDYYEGYEYTTEYQNAYSIMFSFSKERLASLIEDQKPRLFELMETEEIHVSIETRYGLI